MTKHKIEERLVMLMKVLEDTNLDIAADNEGGLFLRTYTINEDDDVLIYTGDYYIIDKNAGKVVKELPLYGEFELVEKLGAEDEQASP